ncbi:MAG: cupin [Dehalococcoidales bacterium]|jgi:mannose-6-phosphate isomerase-like protein (cupin superfamily)|nr:cupin [Dehalococcoidales bacterium]
MLPRKIEKPWGYELVYAETEKYVGKILFVYKGSQLSLQYHKIKDESMYIYKGIAELEIGNLQGVKQVIKMSENESYRIMPGCVHRLTALEDCEVLEVSTPELDDVVRLEDRYGRI